MIGPNAIIQTSAALQERYEGEDLPALLSRGAEPEFGDRDRKE